MLCKIFTLKHFAHKYVNFYVIIVKFNFLTIIYLKDVNTGSYHGHITILKRH